MTFNRSAKKEVGQKTGRPRVKGRDGSTELIAQLTTEQESLRTANEELRTAEEELRAQTEELIASKIELEQAKQRYQELFDKAPDGYIVTDENGFIQDANPEAAALLGQNIEDLKHYGRYRLSDFFPKSATDTVMKSLSYFKPSRWEGQIFRLKGDPFWAGISVSASRDNNGKIVNLRWLIRDIGKRKHAEKALRESEERVLIAKEAAGIGIYDYDIPSGRIEWDDRVREIWGVDQKQAIDYQIFLSGLHPDDREPTQQAVARALDPAGGGRYFAEYRVINRRDGRALWVSSMGKAIWLQGMAVRLVGTVQDITDRKRNEEALQANEELYRGVVENTTAIILRLDLDGIIRFANGRALEFFGYSEKELIGKHAVGTIVPERETSGRDLAVMVRQIASNPDRFHSNANENTRKNGERAWVEWTNSGIYDAENNLKEFLSVGIDATDRKRAEEALRESEARYRSLFQHMLEGFAYCRMLFDAQDRPTDFVYLAVNDEFGRLTGLQDVVGRRVTELIPGINQLNPELLEIYGRVASTGNPAKFETYFKPLSMYLSISVYCPESGYFVAVFHNISERKRAEETLAASEKRFRLLSQTAETLLKSQNPPSIIEDLCREAMHSLNCQAFINYMVDEPTNSLHLNAYAGIPEDQARKIEWLDYGVAVCGCVAQTGERIIAENVQLSSDLRTDLVRSLGIQAYCCHPLKAGDRLIGTLSFGTRTRPQFNEFEIGVMRAIADQVSVAMQRIQAEQRLRELNATLEKRVEERTADLSQRAVQLRALAGELTLAEQRERRRLAKVLHDHLQQLLVGAKFRLAVLARGADDLTKQASKEIEELLDESISSSRSLTAELSPPILHEAGLKAGLEWLGRRMADRHGLLVNLELEDIGNVPDDLRILLFESVRELLFNVTKHAHTRSSAVSMRQVDGFLQLTVSDQGVGFDIDTMLGSGHSGGGFGLFSIRERLGLFGGKVDIQSSPGKGSRIFLYAPMAIESVHPAGSAVAVSKNIPVEVFTPLASRRIRVLLADDHVVVRQGIANLLDDEPDIEVVGMAADGREAVELASKLLPDLILMDVSMPTLNGVEATRIIRNEYPEIRIVGLSMFEDVERAQAMRDAGAVNYITKSGPAEELISAIRKAVYPLKTGTAQA